MSRASRAIPAIPAIRARRRPRVAQALSLGACVALASCAGSADRARDRAFLPDRARPLPPLAVYAVEWRKDDRGYATDDNRLFVVLNRPAVEASRTAHALALVAQVDGVERALPGETRWLDPQLLELTPAFGLPRARHLRLRLRAPLRADDGTTISAGEIAKLDTRPHAFFTGSVSGGGDALYPVGSFTLRFEAPIFPDDVQANGALGLEGDPASIAFDATRDPHGGVRVTPRQPLPPGRTARFAWRTGAIADTSLGTVELPPYAHAVASGLAVLGVTTPKGGACAPRDANDAVASWRCVEADEVILAFGAPLSTVELAAHLHAPSGATARFDDATAKAGDRVRVGPLTPGNASVVRLDAELTDVFGQSPKSKRSLVLWHH
jgi:hypothetical protein